MILLLSRSVMNRRKEVKTEMKMGTYEENEEKKSWIEGYIKKWEEHRGPEDLLTDEDKEIARKSLMQTLRLH